jgi:hypothetical protein
MGGEDCKGPRIFPLGQAEGMVQWGDELFWGIYPGSRIFRQKPLEANSTPEAILKVEHRQDRPFAMIATEAQLFLGTIPDYGELGGALTILSKGDDGGVTATVHRGVVEDQSIVGLAFHEGTGLLFGSTSTHGGLGIDPVATEAKIFVWDVAEEKKVAEFALSLTGLERPAMIGGLATGMDGLIWGAVNGILFAVDPATREVVKHRNIYPDVTRYGRWRPVYLRWGKDGLLYTNLAGRLTVVHPESLESLRLGEDTGLVALGSDGDIYYAQGSRLKKIPVGQFPRQ